MSISTAQIPVIRTAPTEASTDEFVPTGARLLLAMLVIAFLVAILGIATGNFGFVIATGLAVSIAVPVLVTSYLAALLSR